MIDGWVGDDDEDGMDDGMGDRKLYLMHARGWMDGGGIRRVMTTTTDVMGTDATTRGAENNETGKRNDETD